MHKTIEQLNQETLRKSRDYNIDLIDIKHAPKETLRELLGEPLALPSAITRKIGPQTTMENPTGQVFLGIDLQRKPVKEPIKNFALTILSGEDTKAAAHVIMEGFILNGIPGIIFDAKDEFARMDTPNRKSTIQQYSQELEPLSMPLRNFNPGNDVFIDLSAINEKLFSDIAGMNDKKTAELIGKAISGKKIRRLEEIIKRMERVTEEEQRYYASRASRICRLLEDIHPGLFNGPVEANELIAPWMKRIGRIAHINLVGLDKRIIKGILYSVVRTVYEELKNEASPEQIKIAILIEGPDIVSGKGNYIDKEINALIKLCTSTGIGICIRTPNENDLDRDLLMNATAKVTCLEKNQISIKTQTNKPYRLLLRPTLSSY
ncbi:hypothetical protein K8R43_04125 [archaeon]|nr:hypothetical protein [archaeon]